MVLLMVGFHACMVASDVIIACLLPPIDTIYIATYAIVNGEPVRLYGNFAGGVGFGGLYHSYEAHYGGSPHVDFATNNILVIQFI